MDFCIINLLENPTKTDVLIMLDQYRLLNSESFDGSDMATFVRLYGRCRPATLFSVLQVLLDNYVDDIVWEDSLGYFNSIRIYSSKRQSIKGLEDGLILDIPIKISPDYEDKLRLLKKDGEIAKVEKQDEITLDIGTLVKCADSDLSLVRGYIDSIRFGFVLKITGDCPAPINAWVMVSIISRFTKCIYE